jgi:SPP1 family phage portal protein
MKYKLQAMNNLSKAKERKFISGMNRRYKLLFSHPRSRVSKDDWVSLHYQFTPNIPANVAEEAQTAAQLEGIVSQETQLKLLSIVDDVQAEIDRIEEDNEVDSSVVERQMFSNNGVAVNDEPEVLEET